MTAQISFGGGKVTISRWRRNEVQQIVMNRTEFGRILKEGMNSGFYIFDVRPRGNLVNVHPKGWVAGHRRRVV